MSEEKGSGREEVFLTAKQVAARYGVSRCWPYHSPDIAGLQIRLGRSIRWRLSDLEALEAEKQEASEKLALFKKWADRDRGKKLKFDIA